MVETGRYSLLQSFAEHRQALMRFLTSRLGNPALAEDLAHETWLRAANSPGSAIIGNPRSYLFQIASNLAVMAFMFPLALGNAAAVLAGQAIGAGQPERARHICWVGIRLGMSIAVIVSLIFWIGAPQIAALYTTDHQVQAAAIPLIVLIGFYHLGDALQAVAVNALRGYRKSFVPMLIYTITLWGLGIGGGILLGLTDTLGPARGAAGFWIAGIVSIWLVAGLIAVYLNAVSRPKEPGESASAGEARQSPLNA